MAAIPFALSVHHFISSVGADAGFAAIIGLALLVLLFFAQMRETAALRERAVEADEHVQQLELRIAQLSRSVASPPQTTGPAVIPAPAGIPRGPVVPAPAGVRAAAAASASRTVGGPFPVGAVPAAPAGVGAPALASATRLIPSGDDGVISIRATGAAATAGVPAGAAVAAASGGAGGAGMAGARAAGAGMAGAGAAGAGMAGAGAASAGMAGAGGPDAGRADDGISQGHGAGPAVADPPGPRPATAAGGANGGAAPPSPTPIPAPAPAPAPTPSRSVSQPPRPAARSAGSRTPLSSSRRSGASGPPSRLRGAAIAAGGLVIVAVVVVVLLNLTGGSSSSNSSSSGAASSASTRTSHNAARAAALKPSQVTVAVLNGTQTTHLAHDTSLRLSAVGYRLGNVATATDQTLTATVVAYRSRANRRAALLVARTLKLGPASVQPVDQSNEAVACPQASTCPAQVVVTVGADLAATATNSTSAASST